ncbi:MAG: ATP-binding cassette domain-containing protein [Chloroflexi bacterium]|nr:ATP-binding cassette domain-containing protein [Chloroflexota bacterium]
MKPIAQVQGLHFAYPPQPPQPATSVLRGVDLQVAEGEFVAIMGPTGAGKTTLCLALVSLLPHSTGGVIDGRVVVAGRDTKQTLPAEMASIAGLVFQDAASQLFNETVEAEVAFGPESLGLPRAEIERRVDWALRTVRMSDHRHRPPTQLSGGQQKRVAIASVLAMQPQIVVLDEPTAGLDPVGQQELVEVLHGLQGDRRATIILAEQNSELVAEFADRVAVLHQGQIVVQGAPRQVFAQTEALEGLGLRLPQMAELAAALRRRFGRPFRFFTTAEARQALAPEITPGAEPATGAAKPAVDRRATTSALAPALEVESVSYAYPDGMEALQGVDLRVPPGDYLALVGGNGAGKSTLARLLNGLLRPSQGVVYVGGQPTHTRRVGELAHLVGYCFQNPDHQIFCDSVHSEVAFGLRNLGADAATVRERSAEALERFGLSLHASTPPALLGFGERRKVALASLYAMRPPVWILDEPTVGLDGRSVAELAALLAGLHAQGHTVILITHDMRLVADHVPRAVVLHSGRLLWQGSTRQLFSQPDLLARAQLAPPQVAALSLELQPLGMPAPTLSVAEFVEKVPL